MFQSTERRHHQERRTLFLPRQTYCCRSERYSHIDLLPLWTLNFLQVDSVRFRPPWLRFVSPASAVFCVHKAVFAYLTCSLTTKMFFPSNSFFGRNTQRENTSSRPYDWHVEPISKGKRTAWHVGGMTILKAFQREIRLTLASISRVGGRKSTSLLFQFYN